MELEADIGRLLITGNLSAPPCLTHASDPHSTHLHARQNACSSPPQSHPHRLNAVLPLRSDESRGNSSGLGRANLPVHLGQIEAVVAAAAAAVASYLPEESHY